MPILVTIEAKNFRDGTFYGITSQTIDCPKNYEMARTMCDKIKRAYPSESYEVTTVILID